MNTPPPPAEENGNGFPVLVFILPVVLFLCAILVGPGISAPNDLPSLGLTLICAAELAWLLSLYDLMSEGRMGTLEKILWLLMLIFLNVVGTLFYALLKGRYLQSEV